MKSRDIVGALLNKGFKTDNHDHKFYYYVRNGKITSIRTKVSHGKSNVDKKLIGKMARQMRISKNQFVDFVDCILTQKKYVNIRVSYL